MFFGCASGNEDFGQEPGLPSQPQQPLHSPCSQQARHRARDLLRVRSWVPLSSYGNFLRFSPIITSSTSTKPCRLCLVRSGLFGGFYGWIFSEEVKAGAQAQPDGRHGRGPRGATCVSRYRCRSQHPGLGLKKNNKKKGFLGEHSDGEKYTLSGFFLQKESQFGCWYTEHDLLSAL